MVRCLVQLSDLHIKAPGLLAYGRVDTASCLKRAVESVNRLSQAPDAVVLTGDLTDSGRADEYQHLRDLLAPLRSPLYVLPGNHDDRVALRAAFEDHAYLQSSAVSGPSDCVQYAVDLGGLRLVTADTVVPCEAHGALDPARLAHLDRLLADAAGLPTIVALHHPPFRTLLGPLDEIGLKFGADQLAALISGYQRIERVICGHFHRSIQARWAGTLAMCAPSTAHQLVLDLGVGAPAAFAMEPPGFLVHVWDEAGTVVSHQVAIGEFPGPYAFDDDGKSA